MRFVFFLLILYVVVVHNGAFGAENNTDEKLRLDKEIRDLQAVDAAWRRNDTEFRELRKQNQTSKIDIHEFAEFVADLKRQVIEGCEAVRKLGGDAGQHGVDCVKLEDELESKKGGASPDSTRKSAKIKREPTRDEKAALLASQLKELEADFDGMILKEQDKLRERSRTKETAGGGIPTGGSGISSKSKAGPIHREAEPGAGTGAEKQGKMPGFETGDVGGGSDDDIVARQLREAAEIETDPLLKEQLWEEYRKYKNSIR